MEAVQPATPRSNPDRHAEADRERRLLARSRSGQGDALDALTRSLTPLVRHIARGYARDARDFDELMQVGQVGLAKALARFDPSRPSTLGAFVAPTVAGEIRRHLRDTTWRVHVPRSVRETAWQLPRVEDALRASYGREPTEAEVASELGVATDAVADARSARAANLDEPLDGRPETAERPGDGRFGHPSGDDGGLSLSADRDGVRRAMRHLQREERLAIGMAFLEERSQREIGRALGCSQMQVSRMLERALGKLRRELGAD